VPAGGLPTRAVHCAIWAALAVLVALIVALALSVRASLPSAPAGTSVTSSGSAPGPRSSLAPSAGSSSRDALSAATSADDRPLRGVTVCLDPGHGSIPDLDLTPKYPGATDAMQYVEPGGAQGVLTGTPEYEVTLDVALRLRDLLEGLGAEVVMTRTTDDVVLSSQQRAEIANECDADLFIRLHCDGDDDDPSRSGFSTLVPADTEWTHDIQVRSLEVARAMHSVIVSELGCVDGGIVERSDLAGFNFCDVPSVLFEMGFLSNPEEEARLCDEAYRQALAQAIADATAACLTA
jgi:N-acetylmuramoyl-L-alanine amidase